MTKLQRRLEKHRRRQARKKIIYTWFAFLSWDRNKRRSEAQNNQENTAGEEIPAVGELVAAHNVAVAVRSEKKRNAASLKAATLLGNLAFALMLIVMSALVFSLVQSRLTGGPPSVAGYQIYIVKGGSMSPAFEAGSLAFVRAVDPRALVPGDIITYLPAGEGETLTTHRVMEVNDTGGSLSFTTRGDANEVNDPMPVRAEKIIGQVAFAVPYAGYLMNFGLSKTGIVTLVFIPGIFIIAFELRNLFRLASQWDEEKARKKAESQPFVEEL